MKKVILFTMVTAGVFSGCYYDNEEELYPCTTLNITYSNTIRPLLENRCLSCHTGPGSYLGMDLTNFAIVQRIALNDTLYRSVIGDGMKKMPDDGTHLSACEISRIKAWQNAGAPQ